MFTLTVRNPQQGLPKMAQLIQAHGVSNGSRNGAVRVLPEATCITYRQPLERVIFWPERDANPFFHFMEALWMLAGRRDVAFPTRYAKQLATYSDDGKVFHAAYGHRWREHFGRDQLAVIIDRLAKNPEDRRSVLQMWDSEVDLGFEGKDFPCNMITTFQISPLGALNMVVYNRSNDAIWGALGANCVHFSFLQEYIARSIGCPVGIYEQVSSNMHAYDATWHQVAALTSVEEPVHDPYALGTAAPFPLMQVERWRWDLDLTNFMNGKADYGFADPFFSQVAVPLRAAHGAFKQLKDESRFDKAYEILLSCKATDWHRACVEWLGRREKSAQRAKDDGVSHGN